MSRRQRRYGTLVLMHAHDKLAIELLVVRAAAHEVATAITGAL
jgi:hypothetical protein